MGSFYNYGLERLFRKNPAGEILKTGAMHGGGYFLRTLPLYLLLRLFSSSNDAKEYHFFHKIFFYENYATFGCGEGVGSSDQIFL